MKPASFPRDPVSKVLWDCKVTPAYGACQEGNTIGCILNNDGLGAGLVDLFSTIGIHGAFTIVGEGLAGWVLELCVGDGERGRGA